MKRALQTDEKQESLAKRRVRDRESYAALNAGDKKDVLQARSKAYLDKRPDDKKSFWNHGEHLLCGEKSDDKQSFWNHGEHRTRQKSLTRNTNFCKDGENRIQRCHKRTLAASVGGI